MNFDYTRQAKKNSYGGTRNLSAIKYIVIHNTGNTGDTAKNNADYFATGNTRSAGAHIFIDQNGLSALSIPLKYVAYSVGDSSNGHGTYWGKCTNTNSVSIELCDIATKDAGEKMIATCKNMVAWIKSQCPNIVGIIRHYDVTTKSCPARYINATKWANLKSAISGGTYTATTTETAYTAKLTVDGIIGANTVKKWQTRMGTTVDGVISGQSKKMKAYFTQFTSSAVEYGSGGSALIKAWQKYIGADADGIVGANTVKATRKALNLSETDSFDKETAVALQNWLNEQ